MSQKSSLLQPAKSVSQALTVDTDEDKLRAEIRHLESKLRITQILHSWSSLAQHITGIKTGKDFWYLIEVKPQEGQASIESFHSSNIQEAESMYKKREAEL
jgi:hypothetical protein